MSESVSHALTESVKNNRSALSDALFKLAIAAVLAYLLYDKVWGSHQAPAPAPVESRPDPAVVAMGEQYAAALRKAAADSLEGGAIAAWSNVVEAKARNRKSFDEGLQKSLEPLAAEMGRRFGEATTAPFDPAKGAELRKFWRDLATGIRK